MEVAALDPIDPGHPKPASPQRSVVVERADVELSISVFALLVGNVWGGDLPPRVVRKLAAKFVSAGVLQENWNEQELRSRMEDVVQRLRFGLGEYDEEPLRSNSPPRDPADPHERGL
jgi:hypothetical protein